jgi:hypothetical protein
MTNVTIGDAGEYLCRITKIETDPQRITVEMLYNLDDPKDTSFTKLWRLTDHPFKGAKVGDKIIMIVITKDNNKVLDLRPYTPA